MGALLLLAILLVIGYGVYVCNKKLDNIIASLQSKNTNVKDLKLNEDDY